MSSSSSILCDFEHLGKYNVDDKKESYGNFLLVRDNKLMKYHGKIRF